MFEWFIFKKCPHLISHFRLISFGLQIVKKRDDLLVASYRPRIERYFIL